MQQINVVRLYIDFLIKMFVVCLLFCCCFFIVGGDGCVVVWVFLCVCFFFLFFLGGGIFCIKRDAIVVDTTFAFDLALQSKRS